MYPMDYEEFIWALGKSTDTLKEVVNKNISLGESVNRKFMREFRIYMAVGGMPQAISCYLETNNLEVVDQEKRNIISLY